MVEQTGLEFVVQSVKGEMSPNNVCGGGDAVKRVVFP